MNDYLTRNGSNTSKKQMITWFLKLCQALKKVHNEGYIHRDIKPDNIFMHKTEKGEIIVLLGDFG